MNIDDVFVDTSAWVAIADKNDSYNKKAVSVYPTLLKTAKSLITSNFVIAEVYIIILNELGHYAAVDFLKKLNASPRINKIYSNQEIESEAENILEKYDDQNFSFTDAVSFAIMKKLNIKKAFSFDKHFITAGFINIQ
jgi:predicted nucleic acid-binding protein